MAPPARPPPRTGISRRGLLRAAAAVAAAAPAGAVAAAPAVRRRGIPLGFDNFAVRAMGWNARQLVDHAVTLECDSVFITDFGPLAGQHDDAALGDLRRYAADRGVALALGSWSICPSSKSFKRDWGTAEEHLALGIRMARALGSPAFRVILGTFDDRLTPGGIAARIADTVAVLRAAKSRALDAGVKIAVENHAGDMQSRELVGLVEEAGPEFVGVNFDSGNACWALEDPVAALDRLAPHVLTTSLRDTMLWETPAGVTAQWTAMGEGCTDLSGFFDLFEKRCPGVTAHVETISGFAKSFPCFEREFWRAYPDARAEDFARFMALAKRGRPLEPFRPPEGAARADAERRYQLGELERSLRHCRDVLGLGLRG
ncbi:MAG: sugar phosphate isomerase/epimerase family protein [Planctomycetia bacterium]